MNARDRFLDRLRTLTTMLVVCHHAAIVHGAAGGWYWRETPPSSSPTSQLLTVFVAVDQAWFMGFFFLLAGYFSPPALARKGTAAFVRDRLLRLGVPWLVFGAVLGPMTVALARTADGRPFLASWRAITAAGTFAHGPLWFALALLLFTGAWLAWRALPGTGRPGGPRSVRVDATRPGCEATGPDDGSPLPRGAAWWGSALAVGAVALLLRQWVPVGSERWGLQIGYFASYAFLFALGIRAWSGRWLHRLDRDTARPAGRVALVAGPLFFVAAVALRAAGDTAFDTRTGFGLPAVLYAFWEPLVAWGVIAQLLVRAHARESRPMPRLDALAPLAFGAYVTHAPIVVALSLAMRDWPLPGLLKFALLGALGTAGAFAAAALLRRVPGVRRVL